MDIQRTLIDTFFELVQINSPTGQEDAFAQHLHDRLLALADVVQKDSYGNVYAKISNTSGKGIFFTAHMDTVEPGQNIKPKVKGNYLVSDGTTILGVDDKASIAAMIVMLMQIKENKLKHVPIEFIFTKSEEVGNYGAINFDYNLLKAKLGYCFDTANPVGTIIKASPYYERFDITLKGKAAHASKPDEAINVLYLFKNLLSNIELGRVDNETIVNIGVVNSGHVRNTIPGEMILRGEIRSYSEEKLLSQKKLIKQALISLSREYKASYNIEFIRENPGYFHNSIEVKEYILNLQKKMESIPITSNLIEAWGVSDANIINDRNLLCINLGYGGENTHSVQERISVMQLELLLKLMQEIVKLD